MSVTTRQSHRPPSIDSTDMVNRKRLEAELFSIDGQLRSFGQLRERLSAAGKDPTAHYSFLQARRAELAASLKSSAPKRIDPKRPGLRLDESLLTQPIAAAVFNPNLGIFGFGSSGMVQMAPAADDLNILATGHYPHAGDITTIPGSPPGAVAFDGDLTVGPDEIPPSQYDPTISYFWLRTWQYLVPFPAPSMQSRLTYRFNASAFVGLNRGGYGTLMCFVSLGETPNLTTGTNVTVNVDGGWPLNFDLSTPGDTYNGSYGYAEGSVTVQRSFEVGGGHVPGVAIVVGVAVGLPMMSEAVLSFPGLGDSAIALGSQGGLGRIAYSYEPQLVLEA